MISLIIRILIGVAAGIACKFIGDLIEKQLLKNRELEFRRAKYENILFIIGSALFGGLITWRIKSPVEICYILLLLITVNVMVETDIHHRVIPNDMLLTVLVLRLAFGIPNLCGLKAFPEFNVVDSIIGLIVSFIIFTIPAFLAKNVGMGDIKLAAVMGFVLGFMGCMTAIVIMGFLVTGYTFLQKDMPVLTMLKTMIPMGPFLAISMIIVLLLPDQLFTINI
jgi:prepilin signal peptidase PulO-like enzyme (type II secretory pathway)